jgi:hypothetical protein
VLGIGKRYRVMQRDGSGVRAWSPQTRAQALVRFSQRIAAGGFSPWGGPQLRVISEEEWVQMGGPEYVDTSDDAGTSSGPGGPRRILRWLTSSRSRS